VEDLLDVLEEEVQSHFQVVEGQIHFQVGEGQILYRGPLVLQVQVEADAVPSCLDWELQIQLQVAASLLEAEDDYVVDTAGLGSTLLMSDNAVKGVGVSMTLLLRNLI